MTQRDKIESIANNYAQNSPTKKEFLTAGFTSIGASPSTICRIGLYTAVNQDPKSSYNYA